MYVARINGIEGILFIDERISPEFALDGYPYCCHLRHDECNWAMPITIEPFVAVNFFGTFFMKRPFEFGPEGFVEVESFSTDRALIGLCLREGLFEGLFSPDR